MKDPEREKRSPPVFGSATAKPGRQVHVCGYECGPKTPDEILPSGATNVIVSTFGERRETKSVNAKKIKKNI